ncbi:hypothetical protein OUZ56_014038 [Daphnia magna]|uniref:Uncharacterized protein n=1 Tax=Daphnia magna TaxID=35525 RepID=A0ABQ9Z7P4_9CRUS|nr:hypothetical protein OUZ56_014038 [Daphnia magna]
MWTKFTPRLAWPIDVDIGKTADVLKIGVLDGTALDCWSQGITRRLRYTAPVRIVYERGGGWRQRRERRKILAATIYHNVSYTVTLVQTTRFSIHALILQRLSFLFPWRGVSRNYHTQVQRLTTKVLFVHVRKRNELKSEVFYWAGYALCNE